MVQVSINIIALLDPYDSKSFIVLDKIPSMSCPRLFAFEGCMLVWPSNGRTVAAEKEAIKGLRQKGIWVIGPSNIVSQEDGCAMKARVFVLPA